MTTTAVYHCDNPDCVATADGNRYGRPDSWIGVFVFGGGIDRVDLCSKACLIMWANNLDRFTEAE